MRKTRGITFQSGGLPPLRSHVAVERAAGGFTLSVVAKGEKARDPAVYQEFSDALLRAGARAREYDIQEVFIVE